MATVVQVPSASAAFAAMESPRGVELEGRLDLSLDALIKERRKEEKAKKRDAKQLTAEQKTKGEKKKTKKSANKPKGEQKKPNSEAKAQKKAEVKAQQSAKRSALVNKNRGLQAAPATAGKAAKKNVKGAKAKTANKNTSIEKVTAMMRQKMKTKRDAGQQRASVKKTRAALAAQRVVRNSKNKAGFKVAAQQQKKQLPKAKKAAQTSSSKSATLQRSVVRAGRNNTKLKITIAGGKGKSAKVFKTERRRQATKPVLPGKLAAKKAQLPKVTKKTKTRKHQATKANIVVRQPFASRKKKNN